MKIFLRICVILFSIAVWVYSFWPADDTSLPPLSPPAPTLTPVPQTSGSVVTDLLGGQQIRAGKKAKEVLRTVDEQREADLQELE